jgi:hypothetical protein
MFGINGDHQKNFIVNWVKNQIILFFDQFHYINILKEQLLVFCQ